MDTLDYKTLGVAGLFVVVVLKLLLDFLKKNKEKVE
mgnify:CR=1 FL=1